MTEQTRTCATCTENDGGLCDLKGIVDFDNVDERDIEVIGNVFDNADLLEVK